MTLTPIMFFIVCPLVFLAGFVDSIAGGGGLISLPAYLIAGIPPHNALATNKLSSSIGTTVSAFRFVKNKCVDLPLAIPSVLVALIGSAVGANLALLVSDDILKIVILIVLPVVAVYVMREKNLEKHLLGEVSRKKQYVIVSIAALLCGTYDGFYGPGTGTFLLLAFTSFAALPIKIAAGNVKLVNLASNVSAVVTFIVAGQMVYALGLAAAVFSILGHYVGSGIVIKRGAQIVRPIILGVLVALGVKIIFFP